MTERIAFIGGGNMASALIGGLIRQGTPPETIDVVEPFADARSALLRHHGVLALPEAGAFLAAAGLVVWAVKPQVFHQAAQAVRLHTGQALHLSVAAGIRSDSIAAWLGSERVVRAMPNTPALIGKGITALFARSAVTPLERKRVSEIIASTGDLLWLEAEQHLDAVTALSGSGPAYIFYLLEAMRTAGTEMGLPADQAYQLAVATCIGAGELARASTASPEVLRQRVTSPGGTTHAAISLMEQAGMKSQLVQAMHAARNRATAMGDEFGAI